MILVHVLEDVRCVHQDPDGTRGRHQEENVKLQSIDHHRHVLPIFPRLEGTENENFSWSLTFYDKRQKIIITREEEIKEIKQ